MATFHLIDLHCVGWLLWFESHMLETYCIQCKTAGFHKTNEPAKSTNSHVMTVSEKLKGLCWDMACSAGMGAESPNNILKLSKMHPQHYQVVSPNAELSQMRPQRTSSYCYTARHRIPGTSTWNWPQHQNLLMFAAAPVGLLIVWQICVTFLFSSHLQTLCSKVNVSGTFNILGLDPVCNEPCLSCTLPRLCYSLHEWWSEVKHPDQSVFCLSCAVTVNQKEEVGIWLPVHTKEQVQRDLGCLQTCFT